jgi:hypothetical protein
MAVGGEKRKSVWLQRLIFEHGKRGGAGSGAEAFPFGEEGEYDDGEDDDDMPLAERMGIEGEDAAE